MVHGAALPRKRGRAGHFRGNGAPLAANFGSWARRADARAERRQGIGPSRADFEKRRNYQVLMTGMQRMLGEIEADKEREQQARKAWTGGADPTPAALAQWREDSVGDRFFAGATIMDAVGAPSLTDATLPSPQQLAENSGHWVTAVSALVRAVVLEGSPVQDPVVGRVLDLLAPIVGDELALETGEDSDFPETHGPLFLLGACALTDATWAIVGLDPLDQSFALMERSLDEALADAEHAGLPDGKLVAAALVRAFARQYQCQEPRDAADPGASGPVRFQQFARRAHPGQERRTAGRAASWAHHAGRAGRPGENRRRPGCAGLTLAARPR